MKKITILVMLVVMVFTFSSCASGDFDNETVTTTAESSTTVVTQRQTSTTSPVKTDEEKGRGVASAVKSVLKNPNGEISGDISTGSFKYKINNIDSAKLYVNEADEEIQKTAEENAKKLVSKIKEYYPDEIKKEGSKIEGVGSSDENGIDSAIYVITYVNTQNQELVIKADSTGEIFYVSCNFTW